MFKSFLIKYAEIGVKGKNRFLFEDALVDNARRALDKVDGDFKVTKEYGRIYALSLIHIWHVIGNHTYTHIDLAKTGYNEAKKEIEDTNNAIKEITGEKPKFLRPPYGDWNEKLLEETDMSICLLYTSRCV